MTAGAKSGHCTHRNARPSKAAKGLLFLMVVVVLVVVLVVVVVVTIVCPVNWQVRGAPLPIKPKPASQPSNKLQVLLTREEG